MKCIKIFLFLVALGLGPIVNGQIVDPPVESAAVPIPDSVDTNVSPVVIENPVDMTDYPEIIEPTDSDTSEISKTSTISPFIGLGLLPTHSIVRSGNIKPPFRAMVGVKNFYKGFGFLATYEWRNADVPYFENDGSLSTRYARFIFGPTYTFGKFQVHAQMDLFGKFGFFRSVSDENIVATGRKALGISYDVYKGINIGIDYSVYAGVAINVAYSFPISI